MSSFWIIKCVFSSLIAKEVRSCSDLKSQSLLVLFIGEHRDKKYEFKSSKFWIKSDIKLPLTSWSGIFGISTLLQKLFTMNNNTLRKFLACLFFAHFIKKLFFSFSNHTFLGKDSFVCFYFFLCWNSDFFFKIYVILEFIS